MRCAKAMRWHRRSAHLGFETPPHIFYLKLLCGSALRLAEFVQARRDIDCDIYIETEQGGQPYTSPSERLSTVPLGQVFGYY